MKVFVKSEQSMRGGTNIDHGDVSENSGAVVVAAQLGRPWPAP